jgi:hypothetical protein
MLPTLAIFAGAVGLLLIIFLIYRELKGQLGGMQRNMLAVVALVSFVVAAFHIVAGLSGGEGH